MKIKELSENLGLEEDEFLDIVKLFVKTSASNLADLTKAFETGNAENVINASHSLKGAAGNLGFQEIYEHAKFIEMNARQGILKESIETLISLKKQLALVEEESKKNK